MPLKAAPKDVVIGYDPAVMANLRAVVVLPDVVVIVVVEPAPVAISLTKLVPVLVNPALLMFHTVILLPVIAIDPEVLNAIDRVFATVELNDAMVKTAVSPMVKVPAVNVYVPVQVTVAVLLTVKSPLV